MKLLSMFKKNKPSTSLITPLPKHAADYIEPQSSKELLSTDRRQILLDQIWEQTSVSREAYLTLYLAPIERYAELVQELPASETHHHSYKGGMLDHGLEIVNGNVKLTH